jgi:hypothetical protein
LRDLNDNPDLQRIAGRMLAMITSITPSLELIEPLMEALLSILQNAAVSCCSPSNGNAGRQKLTSAVLENQDPQYAGVEPGVLP